MGCGSSKDETLENVERIKPENTKNPKNTKKMKNEKIIVTEDPEQQGEKFHLNEKDEDDFSDDDGGNDEGKEENNKKDSFDDS